MYYKIVQYSTYNTVVAAVQRRTGLTRAVLTGPTAGIPETINNLIVEPLVFPKMSAGFMIRIHE